MNFSDNSFCTLQIGLKISVKGSDYFFNCFNSLYKKCHKINQIRGEPYIHSTNWSNKMQIKIPINKDGNKYFKYEAKVTLSDEKSGILSEKITNFRPFLGKCGW